MFVWQKTIRAPRSDYFDRNWDADLVDHVAAEWAKPVAQGEAWDRPAVPFHLLLGFGRDRADRPQLSALDELIID
ncbi:MAG: hypothetical protein ACXVUL_20485 [Solirubrobacteraceae bacterium]